MSLDVEVVGRPTKVGKYHFFTFSTEEHQKIIEELRDYYRPNEKGESPAVSLDHLRALLMIYSMDKKMQLANFAEITYCSLCKIYSTLMSDELLPEYKAACRARAENLQREALEAASTPFDRAVEGEAIDGSFVAAAALKAKTLMFASQSINPENKTKGSGSTPVHISVNAPFQLGGYFGEKENGNSTETISDDI